MTKYKVLMIHPDGTEELEENVFDTATEAEEHGRYMLDCIRQGAETLCLANPDENPVDGFVNSDYKIIEIAG